MGASLRLTTTGHKTRALFFLFYCVWQGKQVCSILCNFTKSQLSSILLMFVIPQLVYSFWTICLLKVSTHLWSKNDKMIHFTPACCCSSVRRFTASPTPSAVCFLLFVLSLKGFGEKIQSRQDAQTLLVWGAALNISLSGLFLQKIPR